VAWGVFALIGLCFIKRLSLQPSEEIQALMKAPLSKRLVCLLFLKETSVLPSRILAGGADSPSLWQPDARSNVSCSSISTLQLS
jgi:hypothetical protein